MRLLTGAFAFIDQMTPLRLLTTSDWARRKADRRKNGKAPLAVHDKHAVERHTA
jgi:hypothetical protein